MYASELVWPLAWPLVGLLSLFPKRCSLTSCELFVLERSKILRSIVGLHLSMGLKTCGQLIDILSLFAHLFILSYLLHWPRKHRDVELMPVWCWISVTDDGPTLNQHPLTQVIQWISTVHYTVNVGLTTHISIKFLLKKVDTVKNTVGLIEI